MLSELVADFRHLSILQQTAEWNIFEAVLTGDPTTIENAPQAGLNQVGAALVQFPESVFNGIVDAIQNLATGTAGQAAGERPRRSATPSRHCSEPRRVPQP
ncbi:MAG: hypothetical protein ACRDTN_19770 [Mycobacterium sp.]